MNSLLHYLILMMLVVGAERLGVNWRYSKEKQKAV